VYLSSELKVDVIETLAQVYVKRLIAFIGFIASRFFNTTSTSVITSTSTLPSTITPYASLGRLDYFPESLRTLPESVLASITLSDAAKLQEIIRPFARRIALPVTEQNPIVAASLIAIFTSVQKSVVSELGSSGYAYLNFPGFTEPCLLSTCVNQFISQGNAFTASNPSGVWVYKAEQPCCGTCSITAAAVELAYFPTPALRPLVTELINTAANFTFVSP
jgi:hypothetical protein